MPFFIFDSVPNKVPTLKPSGHHDVTVGSVN